MHILAGTSGYAYKEWRGTFYPNDLAKDGMLGYYAEQLPAVEINNTFYRLPSTNVLDQWAQQVPSGFRFALKASRRITHMKRLRHVAEPLSYLLQNVRTLGEKLGPLLFQLPPNLKCDADRLREFVDLLPDGLHAAMEFRHESWFDDTVYDVLRRRGVALCVADTEEGETPLVRTAPTGYFRLRRERYDKRRLTRWLERMQGTDFDTAYVFFKHEDARAGAGAGPKLAQRFLELAGG